MAIAIRRVRLGHRLEAWRILHAKSERAATWVAGEAGTDLATVAKVALAVLNRHADRRSCAARRRAVPLSQSGRRRGIAWAVLRRHIAAATAHRFEATVRSGGVHTALRRLAVLPCVPAPDAEVAVSQDQVLEGAARAYAAKWQCGQMARCEQLLLQANTSYCVELPLSVEEVASALRRVERRAVPDAHVLCMESLCCVAEAAPDVFMAAGYTGAHARRCVRGCARASP